MWDINPLNLFRLSQWRRVIRLSLNWKTNNFDRTSHIFGKWSDISLLTPHEVAIHYFGGNTIMSELFDDEFTPEDAADIDRKLEQQERIRKLRDEIHALGGESFSHPDNIVDPDEEEAFLKHILAMETGPNTTHAKLLIQDGVELPPPLMLDDEALIDKLWEVIEALANRRTFLYHSDHLSNRNLYRLLWIDVLNESTFMMTPEMKGSACHIDLIGSGSKEDERIFLRYYASEDERKEFLTDLPDESLPKKEMPPFDRDKDLPKQEMLD